MAITNKQAELMVSTFVAIHSCNNLADEGNRGSEKYKRGENKVKTWRQYGRTEDSLGKNREECTRKG